MIACPLRASVALWLLFLCVFGVFVAGSAAGQRAAGDAQQATLRVGLARPGGRYTVATMPLETYVARVVAGEAARDSQPAALEALAITVRTFALANRDRHRADGFDLCDETHCQVVRAPTAASERAAQATASQVLMRSGSVAAVFYSASCGGRTEIPSDVWPGADDPPYLPSADDEACGGTPAWEAEIGDAELLRALRAAGFRGEALRGLRVLSHNQSGRIARLKIDGLTPGEISGQDLRVAVGRTLGWQHIKSTAFDLERQSGGYRFSGHGSGHGVGLCVIGSTRLAAQGSDASSILGKYFPGLAIAAAGPRISAELPRVAAAAAPVPSVVGDLRIALPDGDEGERPAMARLASRARDDIARVLGVPPAARVTVRFHPTTGAYERGTGQPWFTTGAIVKGELHLLPVAVLRERGILDRTIRRGLVHLMADASLDKRPVWVREGAALYFAGEPPVVSAADDRGPRRQGPRLACPADHELLHPVSVGALTTAFARARSCFARQIEAGKSWRDVK